MTQKDRGIQRRFRILKYAEETGHVGQTCRYFGIGRASFYRWKSAFEKHGESGQKRFEAFKSAARIWDAERQCRAIKVVDETKILKEIRSIALHISSADFAEVHKTLKFSAEDWNSLGVTNPGSPTITRFLKKETKKVSKKLATAKRKPKTK